MSGRRQVMTTTTRKWMGHERCLGVPVLMKVGSQRSHSTLAVVQLRAVGGLRQLRPELRVADVTLHYIVTWWTMMDNN